MNMAICIVKLDVLKLLLEHYYLLPISFPIVNLLFIRVKSLKIHTFSDVIVR